MQKSEFITLIEHQAWADKRVANALLALPSVHEKSKKLFDHILAAQHTWLSRIENRIPVMDVWPILSNEAWYPLIADHRERLMAIVNSDRCEQIISYKNTAGTEFTNTVSEILLHLTLHSQYHRGQVISYSIELFDKAPVVDMIAFLRSK